MVLKQAEWYLSAGEHPRVLVDGWEISKRASLEFLEIFKISANISDLQLLKSVARSSLNTKLVNNSAEQLTDVVVDAILNIHKDAKEDIDLFMIEIMDMKHKLETNIKLIKGLVFDHGSRHPNMPKCLTKSYILNCNISLEYEKTEINSSFFYSNVEQKNKMVTAERETTNSKVNAIIELKKMVCNTSDKSFVIVNQKGIDPESLDMLAKEGILALRRAKRRNAERLQLSCGAYCVNSVEELSPDCLGYAGIVYESCDGDEKYTFMEDVKHTHSVTILIKSPTDQVITQIKDAIRDGLRSVKNVLDDKAILFGAGAFEVAASMHLMNTTRKMLKGKAKLGVDCFSQALLSIPKILAQNAGLDAQESIISLQTEREKGNNVGLNLTTGEATDVKLLGSDDNYCVKRQILQSASTISSQVLLVDEIIRVGSSNRYHRKNVS